MAGKEKKWFIENPFLVFKDFEKKKESSEEMKKKDIVLGFVLFCKQVKRDLIFNTILF